MIETGDDRAIFSVAFHTDGMQLLSAKETGLRRWRVLDGQEVGNEMEMDVKAISVSRDGKWIVCGTWEGASVWDAKTQEKAIEVASAKVPKSGKALPGLLSLTSLCGSFVRRC